MLVKSVVSSKALFDQEFGEIKLRQARSFSRISIRLDSDGCLKISAPKWVSERQLKKFIDQNRDAIRQIATQHHQRHIFLSGQKIGKTHLLKVESANRLEIVIRTNFLVVRLEPGQDLAMPEIQAALRPYVLKILRWQAKHYLPERLAYFARKHGFSYKRLRLSHAATRWGSWTGRETVSLNIALMQLPNELIDYVIVHELCHSRQANHSAAFWHEVEQILPNYKELDKKLKLYSVII